MNIIKLKGNKAITLPALIITVVVMLIIASVAINSLTGDQIIEKADEAKLAVDYKTVEMGIKQYKLGKQVLITDIKQVSDESLIGTIYKKVYVADTFRNLAVVVVDFEELDLKPIYGYGGEKLLKDDNNDKTTTKEVATLSDLKDTYLVDLTDGTLYYVNGEQIYALDAKKVEVDESQDKKYAIETVNDQSYRFITKWNVTLGEEEGSETYSTVALPINTNSVYDVKIYWGDGTTTKVQHKVNGITLTVDELTAKLTHTYTLRNNDDGIRTIQISGTCSSAGSLTSSTTKLKLIEIEQWGNVGFTTICFNGCTNLGGIIPKNNLVQFTYARFGFQNTAITGLEEGFNIVGTGEAYRALFKSCKKLETIPKSLVIQEGATSLYEMFSGCTNLKSLPESFVIPKSITNLWAMFSSCSNLEFDIPEGFLKNCTNLGTVGYMFNGCTKITKIPENLFENCPKLKETMFIFTGTSITEIPGNLFDTNNGQPNIISNMRGAFENTKIKSIPENLFALCPEITIFGSINWSYGGVFEDCVLLESIPENLFKNNTKVTDFANSFRGCTSLKQPIPTNLFKYNTDVTSFNCIFSGCSFNASEIYIGSSNVSNFGASFGGNKKDTLISKIYLPVDSTTYDSYVAFYGADKVETY